MKTRKSSDDTAFLLALASSNNQASATERELHNTPPDTSKNRSLEDALDGRRVELPPVSGLDRAKDRDDIGQINKTYKACYVIDKKEDLAKITLGGGVKAFVHPALVSAWEFHDRAVAGTPDISDIAENIISAGQNIPAVVRLSGDCFELISGWRRFNAVKEAAGMHLLCEIYTQDEMTNQLAFSHMTIENDLDLKKPVPISCQVETDERLLAAGIFASRRDLSKKAGKSEDWSTKNLSRYRAIPQEIASALGSERMARLKSKDYDRIAKHLKGLPETELAARVSAALEAVKANSGDCVSLVLDALAPLRSRATTSAVPALKIEVVDFGGKKYAPLDNVPDDKLEEVLLLISRYAVKPD